MVAAGTVALARGAVEGVSRAADGVSPRALEPAPASSEVFEDAREPIVAAAVPENANGTTTTSIGAGSSVGNADQVLAAEEQDSWTKSPSSLNIEHGFDK